MNTNLIDDRGQIVGTRLTVYNLLMDFLDPTKTESFVCRLYELSPEQVAAARAYMLNNLDTVLAQHLKIEARIAAGNPPEVIEQAKQTRARLLAFKKWLTEREQAEAQERAAEPASENGRNGAAPFPNFREWFDQQNTRVAGGP